LGQKEVVLKNVFYIIFLIFVAHLFWFSIGLRSSVAGSYPYSISVGTIIWEPQTLSNKQLEYVAKSSKSVILGGAAGSLAKAVELKNYNADLIVYGYLNSRHLKIFSPHYQECDPMEDLFAHDVIGNRIKHKNFEQMLANTSNLGWVSKLVKWVNQMPAEIDGVYLDDGRPTLHEPFYEALPIGYEPKKEVQAMMNLFRIVKENTAGLVIFNGLKHGLKVENYIDDVDGGVMENFIFFHKAQEIIFERFYNYTSSLIEARKEGKLVGVSVESYKENIHNRIFAIASYLLGASEYSTYNFMDIDYGLSGSSIPCFFPEYKIELGAPLSQPNTIDELKDPIYGLYMRTFRNGFVVVNPSDIEIQFPYSGNYCVVIPRGGGKIGLDGKTTGFLTYRAVSSPVTIEKKSAAIFIKASSVKEISPPIGLKIVGS
jgi:hypothetical protein